MVFFQAQRYLGVFYTEDDTEDVNKSIKYLTLAANQHVSQFILLLCSIFDNAP